MTGGVLASILAYKRREVAQAKAATPLQALEGLAREADPPRGFDQKLLSARIAGRPSLIAEIKKASPSKGLICKDFEPEVLARAYERGGAACLSVLTDGPSFQGADFDVAKARSACALPCLRKEFLIDPWQVTQSRALGADAILIILAAVDDGLAAELAAEASRLGMDALFEVHDEAEVDRAVAAGARLIGINNRDLTSFATDLAVTDRLAPRVPTTATLVSESGIRHSADVARAQRAGAKAVLVGESLMRHADVEAATRALLEPQNAPLDM